MSFEMQQLQQHVLGLKNSRNIRVFIYNQYLKGLRPVNKKAPFVDINNFDLNETITIYSHISIYLSIP